MNITDMAILVIDVDAMNCDERDNLFYKTFNSYEEYYVFVNKFNVEKHLYSFKAFLEEMNGDFIDTENCWVIPIFIKGANFNVPEMLMKNSSQDEQNAPKTQENGVTNQHCKDMLNECVFILNKYGKKIVIDGDIYSVNEINQVFKNGNAVANFNAFDINKTLEKIRNYEIMRSKDKVIDTILNLSVEHITDFMQFIGELSRTTFIKDFNRVQDLILYGNGLGENVIVEIDYGNDTYIYGYEDEKTHSYHIYGLNDEKETFMELLHLDSTIDKIIGDDEYMEYLTELSNNEKEEKENE